MPTFSPLLWGGGVQSWTYQNSSTGVAGVHLEIRGSNRPELISWINIRLVWHSKWREKKFFPLFFKLCCYFLNLFKQWLQQRIGLNVDTPDLLVLWSPVLCSVLCWKKVVFFKMHLVKINQQQQGQVHDHQLIWLKWFSLQRCMMLLGNKGWYSFKASYTHFKHLHSLSQAILHRLHLVGPNKPNGCSQISQIITPFNIACYTLTLCLSSTRRFFCVFFLVKSDTLQPAHSSVIPDFDYILHSLFTLIATIIFLMAELVKLLAGLS